jgi:hypothetical protein
MDYIRLESVVFNMASNLCSSYNGGYWSMFQLSNKGFYMAPSSDKPFHVVCENGFESDMSSNSFGISCCLYSFSHLSFGGDELGHVCGKHFHLLREYMLGLPEIEVGLILGAID